MRRAWLLLVLPLLNSCGTYWVDCPDWTGPALVVRTDRGFFNLRGVHVDSSVPEQCTYTEIHDFNPPTAPRSTQAP